jgi:type IV pilus assembly protein PilM
MGKVGKKPKTELYFKSKNIFGFDIGHGSIKVIAMQNKGKTSTVTGYGYAQFDPKAIQDGKIVDVEEVARAAQELFKNQLVGKVDTRSVAVSLPVSHSYSRILNLPKLEKNDLESAVRLEAEQYIPVALELLYIDYDVIQETPEGLDALVSAVPRDVVDSYLDLFKVLNLEPHTLEPSIMSVVRLVSYVERVDVPTLIVDFGSVTTDLIIFDGNIRVTGTLNIGGNDFTNLIAEALHIPEQQAHLIKTKYGLDKSRYQDEVTEGLSSAMARIVGELKKVVRYHNDRANDDKRHVQQIIILGGGANIPGLSTHLTSYLRLPTRLCSTWTNIDFGTLQPPHQVEHTMYATASGLALVKKTEIRK